MSGFYYLATPYSRYIGGIGAAFYLAVENAGHLIRAGVPTFSPIAHTHPIAIRCNINPLDHELWLGLDAPMMAAAKGLIVLQADGWEESHGIATEIEAFKAARKPILYMAPGIVPAELARR